MSRTKKEVNLVKKEVVNLARKEKNGVNLTKRGCEPCKKKNVNRAKRGCDGEVRLLCSRHLLLSLDEEKEEHVFILPCVCTVHCTLYIRLVVSLTEL